VRPSAIQGGSERNPHRLIEAFMWMHRNDVPIAGQVT
jgi:hypothetical protein